jgi:hypothetical protein
MSVSPISSNILLKDLKAYINSYTVVIGDFHTLPSPNKKSIKKF